VLQDADGQFVANATWQAPALDNVLLRYSEDEVRYILNHGRPGSPMAAWGTPGGGPLTTQEIDNIVVYLRTLQVQSLDPLAITQQGEATDEEIAEAQAAADELEADIRAEVDRSIQDGEFETVGEAVFNLGLYSGFRGGALSCGRCHTAGWSLGPDVSPDVLEDGVAGCGGGDPSGIGFNLCGGRVETPFPDDTWKRADGSWLPAEGLDDEDGFYIEAADGGKVRLSGSGVPVTDEGVPYLILDERADSEPTPVTASDDEATEDEETGDSDAGAAAGSSGESRRGDLADCDYVSQLWEPEGGAAYPFAADVEPDYDQEANAFVDPPELLPDEVPGSEVIVLPDGRLAGQCTIIDMPERTSEDHYDFIYLGAEAGEGYGRGGLSTAGMMPGFGQILPPDYIQAVVDYERGL
jgi:mono/diheme cytochrome c family protein